MIAIVRAQLGKTDAFRAIIVELSREVRKEPGCVCFGRY
jgi:quinol monooxygenase YgiN